MFRKYWPLIALIGLYLFHALFFATKFIFPVVDADQLVMADMSSFYARGIIPEPYFWGQNYLFPVESWIATPLVLSGVRADIAIGLVSVILFYAPYLLGSFFALKSKRFVLFLCVALIPFLLPPAYIISTMIPRNFGTTSSLVATGIILILWGRGHKILFIMTGLVIGICFASNPATIVLAPALLLQAKKSLWRWWLPSIATGAVFIYSLGYFYVLHPEAIHYYPEPIALSISQLKESLTSPEILFYPAVLIAVITPTLITVWIQAARKKRLNLALVLLATVVAGLGFLATDRISSYTLSPFYSSYRFWTVLPLLGVVIGVSALNATPTRSRKLSPVAQVALFSVLIVALAAQTTLAVARSGSYLTMPTPTGIEGRQAVEAGCKSVAGSIDSSSEYVQLSHDDPWLMYGCFTMENTVVTYFDKDRRTWLGNFVVSEKLQPIVK